jgi:hypothetical protein
MRSTIPLRGVPSLLIATAVVLGGLDAGSVMLTQIRVPDDVRRAGLVAAETVSGQPVTRQTAQLAFEAASAEAGQHGIAVSTKDFTIYPDGRVTLTGGRTAPTLLLERIEPLRHYAEVRTTVTVEELPYS